MKRRKATSAFTCDLPEGREKGGGTGSVVACNECLGVESKRH